MVVNIGDLQVRDDVIVTIAGTIIRIREDEFLLQDSTGQIWVDAENLPFNGMALTIGESATVTGDRDDWEDFDAVQITRTSPPVAIAPPTPIADPVAIAVPVPGSPPLDNSPGLSDRPIAITPAPQTNMGKVNIGDLQIRDDVLVTIQGRVVRLRDDEFLLRDRTGEVWVEPSNGKPLALTVGERVTVIGDLDDAEDFDARRIIRSLGESITGTDRTDQLSGTRWQDEINGKGGRDVLNGQDGDDVLVGGKGRDRLTGGKGRDRFVYESIRCREDVITDFTLSHDVIDLSQIFDQAQYQRSTPVAAYVQLQQTAQGTKLRIDRDGDLGDASFQTLVTLKGIDASLLNNSHFIV